MQGCFQPIIDMNMNNMNNMCMNNMNMNSMNNMCMNNMNMNNMNNMCMNNMNIQNNYNPMNNCNNIGFMNINQMMPNQVIAGNWSQMYTSNQPNFGSGTDLNPINRKLDVIFKTGKGQITTIFIDYGKTVSYLIQVYFKRMGKPELFFRPKDIGFIFNARLINFNETRLVEDFFSGVSYITITVNDVGDLIGA